MRIAHGAHADPSAGRPSRAARHRARRRARPPAAGRSPRSAAAGPPFPDPVDRQRGLRHGGRPPRRTIAAARGDDRRDRGRTGAEVVVYTQLVPSSDTPEEAEQDAIALIDQWGIGRRGFDDGLVILFDLHESDPCHGQVQLYAGPGYRAAFLSNEERQQIFDDDMLPHLRGCDLDGAAARRAGQGRRQRDARARRQITFFRQAERGARPARRAAAVPRCSSAGRSLSWFRSGRDPVYLDDPSIHIPAPPPEPDAPPRRAGADGQSRAGHLDGRQPRPRQPGLICVRGEDKDGPARQQEGRDPDTDASDRRSDDPWDAGPPPSERPPAAAQTTHESSRPPRARSAAATGFIEPDDMLKFGTDVGKFNEKLERHIVTQGWFRERPAQGHDPLERARGARDRRSGSSPSSRAPTCRRRPGRCSAARSSRRASCCSCIARVDARPDHARGDDPGDARGLPADAREDDGAGPVDGPGRRRVRDPAHRTPDHAVVWGVALGLQDDVEQVLERTPRTCRAGQVDGSLRPAWYGSQGTPSVGRRRRRRGASRPAC